MFERVICHKFNRYYGWGRVLDQVAYLPRTAVWSATPVVSANMTYSISGRMYSLVLLMGRADV